MLGRWNWVMTMNKLTIGEIEKEYPFVTSYFEENKLDTKNHKDLTFKEYLDMIIKVKMSIDINKKALFISIDIIGL